MKNPFSMPGSFVIVTALCVATCVHYRLDTFSIALCVTLGWFVYGKLAIAMSFTQGYGVKKGVMTVLGIPLVLFTFMAVIVCLVIGFLMLIYEPSTLQPETSANLRAFGWSAASGAATAICHWYLHARREYFYESEYNIRAQCQERGDGPKAIEEMIADCRKRGIVR